MIIAAQKRKKNIAEYLLYMWQVEDLIRANGLDIDRIKANVIDRFDLTPDARKEMVDWYEGLIDMMRREGVEKSKTRGSRNIRQSSTRRCHSLSSCARRAARLRRESSRPVSTRSTGC